MANRFYDSLKFDDPWYRRLTPLQKCFWEYLLCKCNQAGIWKPDFDMASFCIGSTINETEMIPLFNERIKILNNGDWFITKFVLFQQKIRDLKELNPDNNAHKSIINILNHCNITIEGLPSPCQGAAKGLPSPTGNSKVIVKVKAFTVPTMDEVLKYCQERKNGWTKKEASYFMDFYESKGWFVGKTKMKSWKHTLHRAEKWEVINQSPVKNQSRHRELV